VSIVETAVNVGDLNVFTKNAPLSPQSPVCSCRAGLLNIDV
jgi:hypothetical protein